MKRLPAPSLHLTRHAGAPVLDAAPTACGLDNQEPYNEQINRRLELSHRDLLFTQISLYIQNVVPKLFVDRQASISARHFSVSNAISSNTQAQSNYAIPTCLQ